MVVDTAAAGRAIGTQDATKSVLPTTGSLVVKLDDLSQSAEATGALGPKLPEKLGPYRVLGRLGQGGMGVVYKGHDETLDRPVALKVLQKTRAADSEQAQLEREARSIAAITHPNVVQVYAAGEQDGLAYFAMELVGGPDLREVLEREGPLPVERARRYMAQAAQGLRAAARKGIFHRDVKPANLLLDAREDQIKVADFGLAKRACVDASMGGTSLIAGTPLYVAPEVIKEGSGDHRADIYSLGSTFFHLLTGQPPFGGKTAADALVGHATQPAPDVRSLRAEVPVALAALIHRCMEKDPAARYASYDELLAELDEHRGAPSRPEAARADTAIHVTPRPVAPPAPARVTRLPETRRSRWPVIVAVVAVVGGLNVAKVRRHQVHTHAEPLAACELAELAQDLQSAGPVAGDLLAPVRVSQAEAFARRHRLSFPTDVGDTCAQSGLSYAICGRSSPVLAWHVHDVLDRTVVFADARGAVRTTGLEQFLRYLRASAAYRRDITWAQVVRNIRPFLPLDADRELSRIESSG